MRAKRLLPAALCTAALLAAWSPPLSAAEPERITDSFSVSTLSSGGGPQVEVSFTLALSEVSSYPVTITATSGAVEEKLWEGSLTEGMYRLRAPLTKIAPGPLKVILKTRTTNRSAEGNQTSIVYRKWEGVLPR
jgi:hypothetical protein